MAVHRSTTHFQPAVLERLAQQDSNPFSKKPMPLRREELRQAAAPMMLELVQNHADALCRQGQTALLVKEILECCPGPCPSLPHVVGGHAGGVLFAFTEVGWVQGTKPPR
jgi:hypothetical protein